LKSLVITFNVSVSYLLANAIRADGTDSLVTPPKKQNSVTAGDGGDEPAAPSPPAWPRVPNVKKLTKTAIGEIAPALAVGNCVIVEPVYGIRLC
jgi:hypothetical protein